MVILVTGILNNYLFISQSNGITWDCASGPAGVS